MCISQQKNHILLCLDRLKAIVEHATLTDGELRSLSAEMNELYSRHVQPPETVVDEN
jgi:hypothetical protein